MRFACCCLQHCFEFVFYTVARAIFKNKYFFFHFFSFISFLEKFRAPRQVCHAGNERTPKRTLDTFSSFIIIVAGVFAVFFYCFSCFLWLFVWFYDQRKYLLDEKYELFTLKFN